MLTLLLADAELERVPQSITGHQQVVTAAKRAGVRPNKMLLDSSLHYAAMRSLEDGQRRGRPDLIHLFLLTALESLLNKAGQLRVLVHTREGYVVRVDPTTRLVRNYNRFCGLIQQLFETGQVPPETPLLRLEPGWTIESLVAEQAPDRVVILDDQGALTTPWGLCSPRDANQHVLCIVGGFPSGSYRSPLPPGERVAFGRQLLTVWTVASELVTNYERVLGLDLTSGAAAGTRPPPA